MCCCLVFCKFSFIQCVALINKVFLIEMSCSSKASTNSNVACVGAAPFFVLLINSACENLGKLLGSVKSSWVDNAHSLTFLNHSGKLRLL